MCVLRSNGSKFKAVHWWKTLATTNWDHNDKETSV